MTAQIRPVLRNMPMLLPPDLRDWIPEDDMVHFIIEAVEQMPLTLDDFHVNHRGTGDKQYPPKMMLALLIYCYANGICASRRPRVAADDSFLAHCAHSQPRRPSRP